MPTRRAARGGPRRHGAELIGLRGGHPAAALPEYDCPRCGLVLDRDVTAARNILARAYPERDGAGDSPRSAQSARADALGIVA